MKRRSFLTRGRPEEILLQGEAYAGAEIAEEMNKIRYATAG